MEVRWAAGDCRKGLGIRAKSSVLLCLHHWYHERKHRFTPQPPSSAGTCPWCLPLQRGKDLLHQSWQKPNLPARCLPRQGLVSASRSRMHEEHNTPFCDKLHGPAWLLHATLLPACRHLPQTAQPSARWGDGRCHSGEAQTARILQIFCSLPEPSL